MKKPWIITTILIFLLFFLPYFFPGGNLYIEHAWKYRIAENFRGRILSQISCFESHPRKFSPRNLGMPYPPMLGFSIPWKFSPRNDQRLSPIRESFLPRKFPAIWEHAHMNLAYTCFWQTILLSLSFHARHDEQHCMPHVLQSVSRLTFSVPR